VLRAAVAGGSNPTGVQPADGTDCSLRSDHTELHAAHETSRANSNNYYNSEDSSFGLQAF
jgi:hypothetical protein